MADGQSHSPVPRRHDLEVAQSVIVGGFILFLCIIAFFAADLAFTGHSVDMGSTAYIINASPTRCNFTAGAGYNIVSVPCIATASVEEVVNPAAVEAIYQYVPGSADVWRVYNPNLPSYVVSDLSTMSRRVGYIAIMRSAFAREINGSSPQYTSIPLVVGWTLVSYPSQTPRNASDAFASLNNTLTRVVMYNKSSESYLMYDYPGGGTLDVVMPEYGYWINSTAAAVWTVYP